MKIFLILVGKTDDNSFADAMENYQRRLLHYTPFETAVVPDIKNRKNLTEKAQKAQEGDLILKLLQPSDYVVLLDERGKEHSSKEFAQFLEKKMHASLKRLVFVIGGPYGFSDKIYATASEKMALSRMTFTHQMVRLIFVEQLYRAMSILKGEPYHHE